jgi:hypothetical protein
MDALDQHSPREIFKMLESLDLDGFRSVYSTLNTLFAIFTPPGETIVVSENPICSEDTTSSSPSAESETEWYSHMFATDFLMATYISIIKFIWDFEWINPDTEMCLSPRYVIV